MAIAVVPSTKVGFTGARSSDPGRLLRRLAGETRSRLGAPLVRSGSLPSIRQLDRALWARWAEPRPGLLGEWPPATLNGSHRPVSYTTNVVRLIGSQQPDLDREIKLVLVLQGAALEVVAPYHIEHVVPGIEADGRAPPGPFQFTYHPTNRRLSSSQVRITL